MWMGNGIVECVSPITFSAINVRRYNGSQCLYKIILSGSAVARANNSAPFFEITFHIVLECIVQYMMS